jgi:hypothetical protein
MAARCGKTYIAGEPALEDVASQNGCAEGDDRIFANTKHYVSCLIDGVFVRSQA